MNGSGESSRRRAQALMEQVLAGGSSLSGEYPLVFRPGFPGEVLALEEAGEVRSACTLLVRELAAGRARLRAGLIGSVSTHPDHRGRGLAGRLLEQAEARLAAEGCLVAFLWADDPGFYARRGWRAAGSERVFVVEPGVRRRMAAAPEATLRSAAPDDHGALHRLYGRHRARTDRTFAETRALLDCPGVETLVLARERDIAAYACLGRGRDLARCVHEWAGAADDVLALVAEHHDRLERRGEAGPVFVMTPGRASAMHGPLDALGAPSVLGQLAMAKLLDPASGAELVRQAARGALRVSVTSQGHGSEASFQTRLSGPTGERALSAEELLAVLLPVRGERAAIEDLERDLGVSLPGLPLELYLWGLDSI